MPIYRLVSVGQPDELLEADSARVEGIHTVLRGTVHVMGRPREVVVRRAPARRVRRRGRAPVAPADRTGVAGEAVGAAVRGDVASCTRQSGDEEPFWRSAE